MVGSYSVHSNEGETRGAVVIRKKCINSGRNYAALPIRADILARRYEDWGRGDGDISLEPIARKKQNFGENKMHVTGKETLTFLEKLTNLYLS